LRDAAAIGVRPKRKRAPMQGVYEPPGGLGWRREGENGRGQKTSGLNYL